MALLDFLAGIGDPPFVSSGDLQEQVVELLRPLDPDEVILFGSRGRGQETADSDIDLAVVLSIDRLPRTYTEKMANIRRVQERLAELNTVYSIDLLVFTRPEWKLFRGKRPVFAAEILKEGRRIA